MIKTKNQNPFETKSSINLEAIFTDLLSVIAIDLILTNLYLYFL